MERWENEDRRRTEVGGREQDPEDLRVVSEDPQSGEDGRSSERAASRNPENRDSAARRDVTSWVNWQSVLYIFVLGWMCVFLVPLTSLWWIVPVLGVAAPIALAMLHSSGLPSKRLDDRKAKERELLHVLSERDELTSTTAAMRTSLTVDEASKMLEELARKGHLKLEVEDGVVAYALRERDRPELPGKASVSLEAGSESDGASNRLEASKHLADPLSERELEVLTLLASGRTNSEVARDLFVSVGTVKSHTGNIYRKLDARNRAEALARARELKVLP